MQPNFPSFVIWRCLLITSKVGCVQPGFIELVFLCQTLPCHFNGFLLEVISKGPVTQHLKESVVIDILSNVVQIVVLSSGTNTLLRVDSTREVSHGKTRITSSQEKWLKLIHSSVGEEQRWIVVWHTWTGHPERVAMLLHKKFDEGLANLVHWPFFCGIRFHLRLLETGTVTLCMNSEVWSFQTEGFESNCGLRAKCLHV